ncbi:MAG: hypothetical protein V2B19_04950 [Pseudomonadota bacterium]
MLTENAEIECNESGLAVAENKAKLKTVSRFNGTKRPVQCLCPKCNKTHYAKLFWTGSGTPRVYCQKCRDLVATICDNLIYETRPTMSAVSISGRRRAE